MTKVTQDQVLTAAKEVERIQQEKWGSNMGWTAVSIYLHLFPDEKHYKTVETGVTAAVQALVKKGKIARFVWRRATYRIATP